MSTGSDNVQVFKFEANRGLVSNQHAHGGDPQSFVVYQDLINDVAGRRRKRPGRGAVLGANAGAEITAMHEFSRVSPTTGLTTYYVFRTFGTTIQRSTNLGVTWNNCVLPTGYVITSSAWVFKNFNNRCWAVNGANHFIYFDGSTGPVDGREWFYVGCDAPSVAPGYSPLTATEYTTGTVSINEGAVTLTGTVPAMWVTGGAWNNFYIDIAGVRYVISTVDVPGDGAGIPPVLTLTTPFKGTNATGASYKIYRGLMEWEEPPQYGIAYFNPTTGHYSNIGPRVQLSEKDQVGRTVTLTGIPYGAAQFQNGFTQIQIFRTPKNGATLVAITGAAGKIANANSGGSTTWTEIAGPPSTYKDTDLSTLVAPEVSNRRPVDDSGNSLAFSSLAEWAGRLFALCPRESRWYCSGAPEDIRVGSPEECWPQRYAGRVTDPKGFFELGTSGGDDQLIVHTAAGDRSFVGYDPQSFNLRRVATRKSEAFQGGATLGPAGLVVLHRDRRLIDYGAGQDLGVAFQDKLDACNPAAFTKARIVWFEYCSRNYLLVTVPTGVSTVNDRTYIVDYDMNAVYEWTFGCSALLANVHNTTTGDLELWGATPNGDVFRLLTTSFVDNGTNVTPTLTTSWLRLDDNMQGRIAFVEIFSSTTGFAGTVYVDEETNITDPDTKGEAFTLTVQEAPYQTAKGKKQVWLPVRDIPGAAFQFKIDCPANANDIVIERLIIGIQRISEPAVTP